MSGRWRGLAGWALRRRKRLALVGLVLLVLAVVGGWLGWAEYHLRAGERALGAHALTRARSHLDRYLRVHPGSARGHLLAARAARAAGDFEEADRHLQACERAGGDTPELRLEGHLLEAQRGALSGPIEMLLWEYVKEDHPQTPLILEALALGYLYVYRLGEARDCLERWLAREPDNAQALFIRGLVRQGLQDQVGAGADYRRAVELAPEHFAARRWLAEYLLSGRQADEAAEHFERLRQEEPDNPEALFGLARCRRELGDRDAARQLLDRLLAEQTPRPAWLLERGRLAQAEEDHAGAEEWFRQAHALAPHEADHCYALAACLSRRGAGDEARRYRERGKEIERDLEQLRHLYEQMGKRPGDAELRYQAVRLDPGHQKARSTLAGSLDE
jgi:tetratricopeptide (TPR) repeat protein